MAKKYDVRCDKCYDWYYGSNVRKCPHPAVRQRIGENICGYCCMKCKFHVKKDMGIYCTYLERENG